MSVTQANVMGVSRTGRFWCDLTGQSDRWMRTFLYAVVFGRLSILVIGLPMYLVLGDGPLESFSGDIEAIDDLDLLTSIMLAPLVESLMVLFVVWLLGDRFEQPAWITVLACVAVFTPLHGLGPYSLWIAPLFAVMAAIQHHWMSRRRTWRGYWLVVFIHAAVNATGVAIVALSGAD